jgi:hypothetical protein
VQADRKNKLGGLGGAVATALLVLLGTLFLAQQATQTEFYMQSQILRSIFARQESADTSGMLTQKNQREAMFQFAGAVTTAYIDFELIPVNEVDTFLAVVQEMNEGIEVESFAYHRKNLTIIGTAQTAEDYQNFLTRLQNVDYFEGVSGQDALSADGVVGFEITTTARELQAPTLHFFEETEK